MFGSYRNFAAATLVLGTWGAVVVGLAARGAYHAPAGGPPVVLIGSVVVPLALFLVSVAAFPSFRRLVANADPTFVTSFQAWRIVGGVFLVVAAFGVLPWEFALPAGLGDVAVGTLAPFVVQAMRKRSPGWKKVFYGWTILGLVDFVVAIGTGTLIRVGVLAQGNSEAARLMDAMDAIPLVIIPAFFVPVFAIGHIAAVMQVRR